ncbi:tyrosine-type recombinase/integrase [Terasakiella sp. A23]|uniref:tyrosine-type recombinase/integrase n=1 Tax=Terasakiella sp. FCG-A23 TaxID=3080561 RepID=UPI0029532506|nr:tyrosine-type recombinase/integrase [Terasakiella sp. A23]MDV7339308.1 tyrosine-type recombinase/integrase [Terasakiella sp. A23]
MSIITSTIETRKQEKLLRTQKIRRQVDAFISEDLPGLTEQPPFVEDYEENSDKIVEKVLTCDFKVNEIADGLEYFAEFIEKGNAAGEWYLPLPERLLRIRGEEQLRTREWFHNSIKLYKMDQLVLEGLNKPNLIKHMATETLLGAVFYFAATRGGLCQAHLMFALGQTLSSKKVINFQEGEPHWVELQFSLKRRPTNAVDENGKRYTSMPWYLPPVCKGLLSQYLNRDVSIPVSNEKKAWSLIQEFVKDVSGQKCTLQSFTKFLLVCPSLTENLHGVHLSQALIQCVAGKTQNVSLPKKYRFDIPETVFEPPKKKAKTRLPEQRMHSSNEDIEELGKQLYASLTRSERGYEKVTHSQAINRLKKLQTDQTTICQHVIQWHLHMLEVEILAVSTVKKYHQIVFDQFANFMSEESPFDLSSEDFAFHYHHMLDQCDYENQRLSLAARLQKYHDFAHQELDYQPLLECISRGSGEARHVRSGYVSHSLYMELRKTLRTLEGKFEPYRAFLEVMVILAYRTGMRLSELLHLQLSDFSDPKNIGNWVIHLSNNKYNNLKSANARRIIPLRVLLNEDEVTAVHNFLPSPALRLKNPNHLLFHRSNAPTMPVNGLDVSMFVSTLMRQLDEKNDLVFHHFRHTAFSNLHFVIENEFHLFERHAGISVLQGLEIYKAIVGHQTNYINAYRMFAVFAGHSSPETTFFSYFHFSDRIIAEKLNRQNETLPLHVIKNLTGLSVAEIRRANSGENISNGVAFISVQNSLDERLTKYCNLIGSSPVQAEEPISLPQKPWNALENLETIQHVLDIFDKTRDLSETVDFFSLPEEHIKGLVDTAKDIANTKTYKKSNRVISPQRAGKIAPAVPKSCEDMALFDLLVSIIKQQAGPEEIRKKCGFLLSRMNTSESEIRVHNIEIAHRIVSHFSDGRSKLKWFVEISVPYGQEEELRLLWKQKLPKATIKLSSDPLSSDSPYSEGIAKLTLQSPRFERLRKEQANKGVRKKYTKLANPVLRYVAHLLLIASTYDIQETGK